MSHGIKGWVSAIVAVAAMAVATSCTSFPEFSGDGSVSSWECLDDGSCECTSNEGCEEESICLNGECIALEDLSDIDINGGSGGRSGTNGSGGGNNEFCDGREPTPEQCNGFDDDCDGDTDEDFLGDDGEFSTRENCGQCGLDCNLVFANLAQDGDNTAEDATTCSNEGNGFVCRPTKCADGFGLLNDADGNPAVCLPVIAANCQICANSTECSGGAGHECVSLGAEGSYCFQRCDSGYSSSCSGEVGEQDCCPDGFLCDAVDGQKVCQTNGGSCLCGPDLEGVARVCTATAGGGSVTCLGTETCTESSPGIYTFGICDTTANVDVCDGKDNDCSGAADELYTSMGAYTLEEHCGACGNNCTTRWDTTSDHAVGRCEASAGPDCIIDSCTTTIVGGGGLCEDSSDCAANLASSACDPMLLQCAKPCSNDSDCIDACYDGWCTTSCSTTNDCEAEFGPGSVCTEGYCGREVNWQDDDGFSLNGCECPATESDEPRIFDAYPSAVGLAQIDRNCDGVEGNEARALFVSEGGSGTGTRMNPLGSIQEAMDAFNPDDHDHILVSSGTYLERLDIVEGVSVYGGYNDDFSERDLILYRTEVLAPEPDWSLSPTSVGVVNATAVTEATVFAGFSIRGYDVSTSTSAAGQASYAVYIKDTDADFLFANNEVIGGRGGDGRSGNVGTSGTSGENGGNGLESTECTAVDCLTNGDSQPGGAAGSNLSCPAADGCAGMESDGAATQAAASPAASCTYGAGGKRATYSGSGAQYCKYDCQVGGAPLHGTSGGSGADGTPGGGGTGCGLTFGSLSADLWSGGAGTVGTSGSPGEGGDGGSAGGAVINQKSAACTILNRVGDLGGSGGGGAAGGCGGQPGAAGQSGGASFAIFVASGAGGTYVSLSANQLTRGVGGSGGDGGAGGSGGAGGKGGNGGLLNSVAWCGGKGGAGGDGGFGGDGGGGGGGCGGPSFAIAGPSIPSGSYSTNNDFTVSDVTDTGGIAGEGGLAPRATPGGAGQAGAFQNVYAY